MIFFLTEFLIYTVTVFLINSCDLPAGGHYHGGARVQKRSLYSENGNHSLTEMNHSKWILNIFCINLIIKVFKLNLSLEEEENTMEKLEIKLLGRSILNITIIAIIRIKKSKDKEQNES